MTTATISRNGQITIPVAIRRKCGWTDGYKVAFIQKSDGSVTLRPSLSCERWKRSTGRSATLAAMEDARRGRNLSRPFSSAEEMIADMLKDD